MNISYKNITDKEDLEFSFKVYASSRIDEISSWGWAESEIFEFLKMQYRNQQRSYEQTYPDLESRLIVFESRKVGRLFIANMKDRLVVVDITILPEFRNKGIGTNVISKILLDGKEQNKRAELNVFRDNFQAQKLYERLGFKQVSMNDIYIQMEWS